eukprot:CAMPEP_0194446466 /NCGR_PEP_ID=MMETSP0176-20130528/128456_1 /TAXON_ID=216777 /ORGANISM="Proboscia alata, Strain PI-D3" /LENGTH=426 /DNA_ID=CAMNT_0039273191 /DNA_START=65 /DNA_END=1345 /DNA_ORIENTATION=+
MARAIASFQRVTSNCVFLLSMCHAFQSSFLRLTTHSLSFSANPPATRWPLRMSSDGPLTSTDTIAERLLHRVRRNDRANDAYRSALPFLIGNTELGRVMPPFVQILSEYPNIFSVTNSEIRLIDTLATGDLLATRSAAVQTVLEDLRDRDVVPALRGWRDELFAVREGFHTPPQLLIERAAAVLFGVSAYGVFLNGYTCEGGSGSDGGSAGAGAGGHPTHVWIGIRDESKATWPGRMDCMVAGGLAAGMLPQEAMVMECAEEAGIPNDLANTMKPVSAVSYTGFNDDEWGLKPDQLFCFDLEVPIGYTPVPVDGEVQRFRKVPLPELVEMLAVEGLKPDQLFCFDLEVPIGYTPVPVDGEVQRFRKVPLPELVEMLAVEVTQEDDSDNLWKPNTGVVLIDFLVRHGAIDANEAGYLELLHGLRSRT